MASNADKSQSPAAGTGNLLSSVPPPSELPNFVLNQVPAASKTDSEPKFSPAIPAALSQNYHESASASSESKETENMDEQIPSPSTSSDFKKLSLNPEPVVKALAPLTQAASSSIFGWVNKAADVSGGLLSKIGEKAMNSMDTLVTTLDPQMKEYIRNGGDVEILIASGKDDKVRPIREAFQTVFGRATLIGVPMDPSQSQTAVQPVGFPAVLKACQDRILQVRATNGVGNKLPVIALENCLVEIYPEHWFDVGLMVLDEPETNIFLETFTQMTPVPSSVAVSLLSETPKDYPHAITGFSVPVGAVMGANLQVAHTEWHESYTGTKRSEFIYLAAKTLATLYKGALAQQPDRSAGVVQGEEVVVEQPQGENN